MNFDIITKGHVIQAIASIDTKNISDYRQSTKYDLFIENKRYPIKIVIEKAYKIVTGSELSHKDFNSTEARKHLVKIELLVVKKEIKIWKVSQPEGNRNEGYQNFTCSQGWNHGGDLSWLFYNYHKDDVKLKIEIPPLVPEWLRNNNDKVISTFWNTKDKKSKNAFNRLFKEIKSGDIIILYNGNNPSYIGEIPTKFRYFYLNDVEFSNSLYPIKYYETKNVFDEVTKLKKASQGVKGIELYGGDTDYIKSSWYKYRTKNEIIDVFPDKKKDEYDELNKIIENRINKSRESIINKLKKQMMTPYIDLLKSNKNLILTGAPGTGKTYLAKQIALNMLFEKNEEKELSEEEKKMFKINYSFVQFHPSYDYTDFVEGLRPVKKDGKELGFELINGTFKAFCKKAKESLEKDIAEGLKKENAQKFVFIIDEINRAEISKVFGELFFSIDPGYRGEKGKVKTQYANIQSKETFFTDIDNDFFYIPENVYIIGTMNDIDRSVESFDFAMRRRFAWKEIKAEDRTDMLDSLADEKVDQDWIKSSKLKLTSLNNAIWNNNEKQGIEGLNSSYHIGPAYFLKLKNYKQYNKDDAFQKLWEYHIKVLFQEYLRGMHDAEKHMEDLLTAYNSES